MYLIMESHQVSAHILHNTAKSCVFFQASGPLSWGKWQASMFLWLPCTMLTSSPKESREFRWAFKWVSLSSSTQQRSLEFNAQNTADTLRRNAHVTELWSGNLHDLFMPWCMQGNRVQHPLLIGINDYTRKINYRTVPSL